MHLLVPDVLGPGEVLRALDYLLVGPDGVHGVVHAQALPAEVAGRGEQGRGVRHHPYGPAGSIGRDPWAPRPHRALAQGLNLGRALGFAPGAEGARVVPRLRAPCAYVPIEISREALERSAASLAERYPNLSL